MVILKSFHPNSAGSVDGLRPGHLKDLIAPQTAETGRSLMKALANLCSKLLRDQIPQHACDLLLATYLTALRKKDGGIRPIVVGNIFRRLASKIAAKRVIPELRRQLPLVQLGVCISGGCEAAAHAVHAFVQSSVVPENNVLVKLDVKNAFNTVRQDHFPEVCSSRAPSILHLASTAYATSSHLVIGNETILSETGVQRGNPLGLVQFALAVDKIARSVRSPINIWYLYDAMIGGPVESVCVGLDNFNVLEVNPSKLEVLDFSCDNHQSVMFAIESTLPRVTVTEREDLNILRAPINIIIAVQECLRRYCASKQCPTAWNLLTPTLLFSSSGFPL